MTRVRVIAEIGVNHDGDFKKAVKLIEAAAEAGADMVKFQVFRSESVCHRDSALAPYQMANLGENSSQLEMIRRYELSHEDLRALKSRAESLGVGFLASPFDLESLRFLVLDLGQTEIKIPSGEVTHFPLLVESGKLAHDVILSTGASSLAEVEVSLALIAFGMCVKERDPRSVEEARSHVLESSIWEELRLRFTLLHCVTNYPAQPEHVNLRAINTLGSAFGTRVGLSDHSLGSAISVAAIGLGASVIEKHITLDTSSPGPDHAASLTPGQFARLVQQIREVELAMGSGRKVATEGEFNNREIVRRKIAASRVIRRGELLSEKNLVCLRSPDGLSSQHWFDLIGQSAPRDFEQGEVLNKSDLY